jgi:hypothetical protein
MARRVTVSLVALPMAVLLTASCGFAGTEPVRRLAFTHSILTHRGEHLVLDVAAAVLPDSTPANIACTGAVAAAGVGVARDSVPVLHGDAPRGFLVSCWADLEGSRATATVHYWLYGPSPIGTWVGRGTVAGQRLTFEVLDPAVPCANRWTIDDTELGSRVAGSCVALEAGTPDSLILTGIDSNQVRVSWRLEASRSDYATSEYRSLRGMIWTRRLGDPANYVPYLVERH